MSARGKDVRCEIGPSLHERLAIIAEFEGVEIAALAAAMLEKTIVGEWHRYARLVDRANCIPETEDLVEPGQTAGFVYVIRLHERYKIGKALDWRKRLSNAMFPEPPHVVCVIATEDRHQLEKELHARYAEWRCHGEWFLLEAHHVAELYAWPGARAPE